jgi:hypothetical protein
MSRFIEPGTSNLDQREHMHAKSYLLQLTSSRAFYTTRYSYIHFFIGIKIATSTFLITILRVSSINENICSGSICIYPVALKKVYAYIRLPW